ncbi:MAG: diphthine--ammonia ligase [Aureispira sp.]|nr:diphthine--ammonia ligase [Aureispira sp.]
MNWSGGKDSALSLYQLQQNRDYEVAALLTTINKPLDRITMHGVRSSLLEQQAKSLGLELYKVELPELPDMDTYGRLMNEKINELKSRHITHGAFGDIYLEDLKTYREAQLKKVDMQPVFPIWQWSTKEIIRQFIDLGFRAVVVCVNAKFLDKSFVGRELDASFIADLPDGVDICGENGEFHSFVYDGPNFQFPIAFERGEIVHKSYEKEGEEQNYDTGFYFCDLL